MRADLPTEALSIMQPWAWLIVNGHKDIENRDWRIRSRLPRRVLIHAGKKIDGETSEDLLNGFHPVTGEPLPTELAMEYIMAAKAGKVHTGGIVGVATITGCIDAVLGRDRPWFVGRYGFTLADAEPLPFMPCKGALSFFPAEYRDPAS